MKKYFLLIRSGTLSDPLIIRRSCAINKPLVPILIRRYLYIGNIFYTKNDFEKVNLECYKNCPFQCLKLRKISPTISGVAIVVGPFNSSIGLVYPSYYYESLPKFAI